MKPPTVLEDVKDPLRSIVRGDMQRLLTERDIII